jgi:hypothetical protein
MMSARKLYAAVLFCAASFTAPAALSGSIMSEAGGNFSSSWVAPTVVATGTTGISGSGAPAWMGGVRHDVFQFAGLTPGASSITFDFSLTESSNPGSYANGGGSIYYSFVPFSGSYYVDQGAGKVLGSQDLLASNFDVTYDPWNPSKRGTSSFVLNLTNAFAGDLFLALDFTYGRVSYNINLPSWAASDNSTAPPVSSVPLPPTVWLMLTGLLGLAFARQSKRA